MSRRCLAVALAAVFAVACSGNPAREPQPAPGPAVTTDQPTPSGVEVAVR
jgi:hypothetical protein